MGIYKHYTFFLEVAIIAVNYLIQDGLLHCIALNVLQKQPSFFASHKVSLIEFNVKYYQQLEPYINSSIFDNKENFNKFMSKAIGIYYNDNINNNFWKGTGFENIADDIWEKKELIFAFPQIFIYNRRYVRINNTNVFKNYSTGEEVLEEILIETPIS